MDNDDFSPVMSRNGRGDHMPLLATGSGENGFAHRQLLLADVSYNEREPNAISARIVSDTGEVSYCEAPRLIDFTRQLWPRREERGDPLNRVVRFLLDLSKTDFLIRLIPRGVLVRGDFLRAIIEPTRVVFFNDSSENVTFELFLEELLVDIKKARGEDRSFSLRVVECIVCANVTLHDMRFQLMGPVVRDILDSVEASASEASILRLYPLKLSLSRFVEGVRPLDRCLQALLQTDGPDSIPTNFLEAPSFTRGFSKGSTSSPQIPVDTPDSASLENLLEPWARNVHELMAGGHLLLSNVEDSARFLEAAMSHLRNRLLMLELLAMVITLALTFGAVITGIFGMNLKSGVADADYWFITVVVLVIIGGVLIIIVSLTLYSRSRRYYHANCAAFGNNVFFESLKDDAYIFSLGRHPSSPDGDLARDVRDRILQDLRTPPSRHRNTQKPRGSIGRTL